MTIRDHMKAPPPKPPPSAPPPLTPPTPEPELPIVGCLGIAPASKGQWVVFALEVQGDAILKKDILTTPASKAYTLERLKVEIVKRFHYAREKV